MTGPSDEQAARAALTGYIHGRSAVERERLLAQAEVLAPVVLDGLALAGTERLLELGCGVGAELLHLRRLYPALRLTGIDHDHAQIVAARANLAAPSAAGATRLLCADAAALPFADGAFDVVLTVWLLEHISAPAPVMSEALRVLRPGGWLWCIEVENASFALTPLTPAVAAIADWWAAFNAVQARDGDPFVGRQLATLARAAGAEAITTANLSPISSRYRALDRARQVTYLRDLLLSGAPHLLAAGAVAPADVAAVRAAFAALLADPRIDLRYFAVRLACRRSAG